MPKLYGGKLATVRLWGVLNLELRDGYKVNSAKWASQRNYVDERRCPRRQDAFKEQTPVVKISKLMTRSEGAIRQKALAVDISIGRRVNRLDVQSFGPDRVRGRPPGFLRREDFCLGPNLAFHVSPTKPIRIACRLGCCL